MSPASVPAHSKRGSLGRYLVAGLAGGLFAASLLSFIDWWLMLRQAGRGGGGDSIAALCYAYLLLGPAGICAGLCLALAATMREWYFRLTRAGRMPRRLQLARITFMFSFILGGGALLVYGWMPHWLRTGTRPPWSTGWFFTFLLAGLVVGSAQRFLLCRYADKVGPRVPKLLKAAVAAVLLIMLASAAAGWQLTSGSRNNSRTVWTAPAVAAVNRAGPGSGGERPDGLPVVVLLLDTLRWDALSCYGSSDIRTPHLDRFCREAVQFEVAPGLLELAGLGELIPEAMSGQSLARLLGDEGVGNSEPQRSFHADELLDGNELTSLIEGRWKYVRANSANPRGLPREALYDVAEDPGEKVNLVRQRPELAAALAARLDRLLQAGGQGRTESSPVELDAETTEHLRALGYLR